MIVLTLPDNRTKTFPVAITFAELAESIGSGLQRDAIAGRMNGKLHDLGDLIDRDAKVAIVTDRDPAALDITRHTCAHLFAHALKQLYPASKMAIGPVIEDGFYYDFALESPLGPQDLETIHERMVELARKQYPIFKRVLPRTEVIRIFREREEDYKLRLIDDLPDESTLALYFHEEYVDMCRGPHLPSMRHMGVFQLTRLAGAYWRGDAKNAMLQRVYGTCWLNQTDLDAHLHRLAEAEKRDHRKLGKKLRLFHIQEEAPGMIFWHPRGMTLYRLTEQYMRGAMLASDYQEVRTPQLLARSLWEQSGHWDKFQEMMFTTASEQRDYAIKPMNCPGHVQIFNQGLKSYRDLPLRLAEFGSVHRNEPSGTLHGLLRVRNFTQDDAHIFVTEAQLQQEVAHSIALIYRIYRDFGFTDILLRLATRPEQRVGSDAIWDKSEQALRQALGEQGLSWEETPGEGAFYGPKIEFSLRDSIGRVWQCGTIQVDFSMPERLGATYVAADGARCHPVMIHQAVLGSLERFIGILVEHYGGDLPLALSPLQVMVLGITDAQSDYVNEVTEQLRAHGIRTASDLRQEKVGYKIREHSMQRVPFLVILGAREVAERTLAVRDRTGKNLGACTLPDFLQKIKPFSMMRFGELS